MLAAARAEAALRFVFACCAAGKRRCRFQQPIASADARDRGPPRNTRGADAEQRAGALARIPMRVAAAVESDGAHASHATCNAHLVVQREILKYVVFSSESPYAGDFVS